MKKSLSLIFALMVASATLWAQETVVWGSEVIDVSSEFGRLQYSAIQALHKPNVLPSGGDNPNAWRPKSQDNEEFIVVSFDSPIRAKQVAIAESENPGAVKAIYAYDENYDEYTLFELEPRTLPIESRLLNLFFDLTSYNVYAIKVVLDGAAAPGYNAIDAIGISSSNIPISVLVNLVAGLNPNMEANRLGSNVNSKYIEHSPVISPDGKRLYFSRRFHPDNMGGVDDPEDIWYSELDERTGEWLPAVNVGPPLNNEGPNFVSSVTVIDGSEVLLLGNKYGKNGRMYSGVSLSRREEDTYAQPMPIDIENEYNYSPKADFSLSPMGNSMVISVDRDDTFGGRDLYVCFKMGVTWSEPLNLGDQVNTAGEDFAPFLANDNKTLYFSTNGISGYGGSDIFVTMRLDDTWQKWSVPENLGSAVNSEIDDQYFSIPTSGSHIYFARGESDEDTDIYSFLANDLFVDDSSPIAQTISHLTQPKPRDILLTVRGKIMNAKTNEPINKSTVIVERLPDGIDVGTIKSEDGTYQFTVRAGARYGLLAKLDGFLSTNQNFDFNEITESDTLDQDLYLTPIEHNAKIVINNIFFEFDRTDLKTSSYPELNRILDFLKDGQIAKIQISGHTDALGTEAYNQQLSERRAKAVYQYFLDNGVNAESVKVVGYGESQPVADNSTEEGRAKNRRVEFEILEK